MFQVLPKYVPWLFVMAIRRSLQGEEVASLEGGLVLEEGL